MPQTLAPILLSGGPGIYSGAGSPEGAVTAAIGSQYLRTDGGAGTSVYNKESGSGNTGWVADSASGSGIPATTIDAKGDLLVGTANDTVARMAVGANGYVLKADSAQTPGLRWAPPDAITPEDYGAAGDARTGTDGVPTAGSATFTAATGAFTSGDIGKVIAIQDAGIKWLADVRVATTANITLSGTQTIDGVAVIAGDRVLVKNQTTASANGIYVVAAGAWARSTDADISAEVVSGIGVKVTAGTVSANLRYYLSTTGAITLGTTNLTFTSTSVTHPGYVGVTPHVTTVAAVGGGTSLTLTTAAFSTGTAKVWEVGTDDSADLLAALTAAAAGGVAGTMASVSLQPGRRYLIASGLDLSALTITGLTIFAYGATITCTNTKNAVFTVLNASDLRIFGGVWQHATPSTRDSNYDGLRILNCTRLTVAFVRVRQTAAAGMLLQNITEGTITNCTVQNTKADGIHITNVAATSSSYSSDVTVTGNIVQNADDDSIAVVSYDGTAHDAYNRRVAITGNVVKNGGSSGIDIVGGLNITVTGNTIENVHDSGIAVQRSSAYGSIGCEIVTVTGNTLTDANRYDWDPTNHPLTLQAAILVQSANNTAGYQCKNVNVLGNIIKNARYVGIQIGDTSAAGTRDVVVSGNDVTYPGTPDGNAWDSIDCHNTVNLVVRQNNINTSGRHNIRINSTVSGRTHVLGNLCADAGVSQSPKTAILYSATNSPLIRDNEVTDSLGNVTIAIDAGAATGGQMGNNDTGSLRCILPTSGGVFPVAMVFAQTSIQANDTRNTSASELAFATTYTIPANALWLGRRVRIRVWGTYSTLGSGTVTLQLKVKLGTTIIGDTGTVNTLISIANRQWYIDLDFVVISVGSSGTIEAQGVARIPNANTTSGSVMAGMVNTAVITINTTTTQAVSVTVQHGASSVSNTATMRLLSVEMMPG